METGFNCSLNGKLPNIIRTTAANITNASTSNLKTLGIIEGANTEAYLITLQSKTGVSDGGSQYIVRYVSSNGNYYVTPIAEGSSQRAPRVSSSGVLTLNGYTSSVDVYCYAERIGD